MTFSLRAFHYQLPGYIGFFPPKNGQVNPHTESNIWRFKFYNIGNFILIDFLQKDSSRASDGVLVNPGALIRYAYSFRQALVDLGKPVVEIHMSDIDKTGVNKKVNVLDDVRVDKVTGLKEGSYYEGFKRLVEYIKKNR